MHFASSYNQKKDNNKFKNKNNQNCQKIELYGSLTIRDLKKKDSSKLVGGWRRTAGVEWTHGKVAAEGQAVPHSCADKLGGTTGELDRPHNPGFWSRDIKPQNLWLLKPVEVVRSEETPSLTRICSRF